MNVLKMEELTDDKLSELIDKKSSFLITEVKDKGFAVEQLEKTIEEKGLNCRIYTKGRAGLLVTAAIPNPITLGVAALTSIGILSHRVATMNPDFEIVKSKVKRQIEVIYKK